MLCKGVPIWGRSEPGRLTLQPSLGALACGLAEVSILTWSLLQTLTPALICGTRNSV